MLNCGIFQYKICFVAVKMAGNTHTECADEMLAYVCGKCIDLCLLFNKNTEVYFLSFRTTWLTSSILTTFPYSQSRCVRCLET